MSEIIASFSGEGGRMFMSLAEEQQDMNCKRVPPIRQVYTVCQSLNESLNNLRDEWKCMGIRLWIDGDMMEPGILSDAEFQNILLEALQLVLEAVQQCQSTTRRVVQLRTMRAQHREFIKLIYASDMDQSLQDEHYQTMKSIIENKDGYLKLVNQEHDNVLMIAIPTQE